MPLSVEIHQTAGLSGEAPLRNLQRRPKAGDDESGSKNADDEINAYIAIRDSLLVEAEKVTTHIRLDRVQVANEFVETCLRPARSPYEAQCLTENDAIRERERCAAVKARIVELRLVVV